MRDDVTALEQLIAPLRTACQDFSAAFVAMNRIKEVLAGDDAIPVAPVFGICEQMLACPIYRRQKQAYFFYQVVAEVLQLVALRPARSGSRPGDRRRALAVLQSGMDRPHEARCRAMAEALGTLPLDADNVPVSCDPIEGIESRSWDDPPLCDADWFKRHRVQRLNGWVWQGRSLLAETRTGEMLVVKCLRAHEDPRALRCESAWMAYLRDLPEPFGRPFAIPEPLADKRGALVQAPPEVHRPPNGTVLHPQRLAIAFLAPPAYFHYPNETAARRRLDGHQIREVLSRNAWLLGRLMAMGIAHTAPIPLFHNRAQRHRRDDGGRYRWTHAGRLDRWLASCRYPNFGASGLRDFEHFEFFGGRTRYRYEIIGSHLISLLLVAGSYFRSKAPERIGLDACGKPMDTRDLFNPMLLQTMIGEIYEAYYEGFTGEALPADMPIGPANLVDRMIAEMGMDRHMEEILRVVDQDAMDRPTFTAFLENRGMPRWAALKTPKGQQDIILMTGPHLGGFNQAISLPELIEFAAAGAARCVAGRFCRENDLAP